LGSVSFSWICPVKVEKGIMLSNEEEDCTIDRKLHKLLHRIKSLLSTKWSNDVRPTLDLVFAASAVALLTGTQAVSSHNDDNCLYCLVVKYKAASLGLSDNGDGQKQMIHLKWIFMLDQLTEKSAPVPFPVTCCQLWKDPQWLPKQQLQWQMKDLMPPWKFPLAEFSLDDIPSEKLALKNRMKAINSFLLSFIDNIRERDDSWEILPILMVWILCPVTKGWHYMEWDVPCPDSKEANVCQPWQVLNYVQKLRGQQQP